MPSHSVPPKNSFAETLAAHDEQAGIRACTDPRRRNRTMNETTDEHRSVLICVHPWSHFMQFYAE